MNKCLDINNLVGIQHCKINSYYTTKIKLETFDHFLDTTAGHRVKIQKN